ncbi:DUF2750 domain-containing protein [Cellulomonas sp. zg-Y338]|nr:DUF2750 domain-containing protein [Cellulomonas chengniuliangii]
MTEFRSRWLPGLGRDGIRVGVHWSGGRPRPATTWSQPTSSSTSWRRWSEA